MVLTLHIIYVINTSYFSFGSHEGTQNYKEKRQRMYSGAFVQPLLQWIINTYLIF